MKLLPTSPLLLLLATSLVLAAAPAGATHANPGTLKVHDNETENPDQRNVPHVSCDFWLEAFGMSDDEIAIKFFAWPPTGNMTEVAPLTGPSNATADSGDESGGFHFLVGPYTLPEGHYRVEIYTGDGHPGSDPGHAAKSKTFWVEPCDQPPTNPPCPPDVTATPLPGNEGVLLNWTQVENATAYNVYRAVGEGDFELLATVGASSSGYEDLTAEPVNTYSYYVTAVVGNRESVGCEIVTITLVPFFPGLLVGALALAGTVGAYAWLRRKA